MPLSPLPLQNGIYTLETDRGAKNRWKSGDKVRFRDGLPQKIGGWVKEGVNTFQGVCRALLPFVAIDDTKYLGLGTHLKLYVWSGGTYYDVTPIRASGTLGTDPFSMSNGSAVVTVTHTSHGAVDGDFVTYSGATAAGGITINGEYQLTYIDANSYSITHSSAATSTATGGGASVAYSYQINVGSVNASFGRGWGAGAWGASTWGTPRSVSDIMFPARVWSMERWGEDMIANPTRGSIYVWDTSGGTATRATKITNAPATARRIVVHPTARILVALGAHDGVADDPLNVAWCDEEDYNTWTPTTSNSAGSRRLFGGTEILTGVVTDTEIVILTNTAVIAMTFIGPPDTFGFVTRDTGITVASQSCALHAGGRVYWMGKTGFYVYDGRVQELPCDVRNYVFDDINLDQIAKVTCGLNVEFNEIWWFYPSADSDEIDRYVAYNHVERFWMLGTLSRTAYNGAKEVYANPVATDDNGYLFNHETGTDADSAAMSVSAESYDADLGEGEQLMLLSKLIPDFSRLVGSVRMTFKGRKYPHESQFTKGPYTVTSATKFINPRMRARQIAVSIDSSEIGDDWRMGQIRVDVKPDGGR